MAHLFSKAKFTLKGDKLSIAIPLEGDAPSESGKTILLATDSGGTGIMIDTSEGKREIRGTLNVTVYPDPKKRCNTIHTRSKSSLAKNVLTIETQILEPTPSASGKTLVVAKDSGGTGHQLAGRDIMATFSMWVYPTEKK